MSTINWDITESLPASIGGRSVSTSAVFRIDAEKIDVAIGNLPFLLFPSEEHPYERSTAQWQKDQFDADRNVGEQSLTGWWLRSQSDFSGGAGVNYYEPLVGEGSEHRFLDSRGVDPFDPDGVRLLRRMVLVQGGGGDDLEAVGIGLGRTLYRDGGEFYIIDEDSVAPVTPIGDNPRGITRIPDSSWLIGHDSGISRMRDSGATSDVITGAPSHMTPFWVKDRIFATRGHRIYQLTLAGGTLSEDDIVHQNPSTAWRWVGIVETPGAIWAAGGANSRSHIVAFSVDGQGSLPEVDGAPVRIEMPLGERITALESYSDFLLIGTTEGFRIAVTDGDHAQLGPLLWDDEEVHAITARGDHAWVGISGGRTRKVDLGVQTGPGARFAWAHAEELPEGGDVQGLGWVYGRLVIAAANVGAARQHDTELVESGHLDTGFMRFGTLERKRMQSVLLLGDSSQGSLALAAASRTDAYAPVTSLGTWVGSREVGLNLPGGNPPVERMSLRIILNRSEGDATRGPLFEGYQLRALPIPARKQRLIALPLMLKDRETTSSGVHMGGPGFAWVRLRALEKLENEGTPVIFRDFRTGESHTVVIDRVQHTGLYAPDRGNPNFGGHVIVTLRTVD